MTLVVGGNVVVVVVVVVVAVFVGRGGAAVIQVLLRTHTIEICEGNRNYLRSLSL